ncbi:MAG TPA: amidohydrolase family protein [Xanthobacteraceae bacterium]|jgi:predicted TIM-barrel fold metal-dependent hydrolase
MSAMLSRRGFLNATLGAGAGSMLAQPAAAQSPAAQSGARRIIVDSQVHQWKAQTPDRPWPPGRVAQLPEPFGYDKLLPMMNEAGVDRVVIVPPSWEGERNDYALEAATKYPDRFAVMGRIPLSSPLAPALLPQWKQQKGMLGIRLTFNGDQAAWLTDGTADWFWPAAEQAGIPVMFFGGKMSNYSRIAERHPQLALIIDHMGLSLDIAKADKRAEAIDQTVALAKFANVSVKLSAAPAYSFEPYPYRDMAPHIRRCFDAFGPRRCFWGTDMTNSFTKATYRQRVTHFTEGLDFLSEDDKDWIMGRAILARLGWA